jgi:uncharacterized protein
MRPNASIVTTAFAGVPAEARVAAYDWQGLAQELDGFGCAILPKLLSPVECRSIAGLYPEEKHFRSHVHNRLTRPPTLPTPQRYITDFQGPCAGS